MFRELQTVYDLKSASLFLLNLLGRRLGKRQAHLLQVLTAQRENGSFTQSLELPDEVWKYWAVGAASPERGKNEFLLSTCVYLIERLADQSRGGDLSMEWEAFSSVYCSAPDGIRSAITNGFFVAFQSDKSGETPAISIAERTTRTQETVVKALLPVAQEMTPDQREMVSKFDYGCDSRKHLDALNVLFATDDCRYPKGECWFPAEVVELGSHESENRIFAPCTAIVLLNAIYDDDSMGHAEFRWESYSTQYLELENHHQSAILGAFRHLYETLPDWPFFDEGQSRSKTPPQSWVNPWFP